MVYASPTSIWHKVQRLATFRRPLLTPQIIMRCSVLKQETLSGIDRCHYWPDTTAGRKHMLFLSKTRNLALYFSFSLSHNGAWLSYSQARPSVGKGTEERNETRNKTSCPVSDLSQIYVQVPYLINWWLRSTKMSKHKGRRRIGISSLVTIAKGQGAGSLWAGIIASPPHFQFCLPVLCPWTTAARAWGWLVSTLLLLFFFSFVVVVVVSDNSTHLDPTWIKLNSRHHHVVMICDGLEILAIDRAQAVMHSATRLIKAVSGRAPGAVPYILISIFSTFTTLLFVALW